MLVREAIDAQGQLVSKLPWISNLQISSIQQLSEEKFRITLVNQQSVIANGDDELEGLNVPLRQKDRVHGPRYESAEDLRARRGWDMTLKDYAAHNFRKRNGMQT